jgi:DNA-binding IclR family transcriptional regulator
MAKAGIAITTDEITPGVWACAAPVTQDGKVVATISVAGLAFRIGRARRVEFEALVRGAAAEISAQITEKQWPMPRRLTA